MRTVNKSRVATAAAYVHRVNLAIDYIGGHLGEPLRLEDVARAAKFSPYHFHRVFQMLVGETVADFVKRLRLEKALLLMAHSKKPSLSTIAMKCGFSSSSDFSRSFKQRFAAAPSAFDFEAWRAAHRSELEAATLGARRFHIDRLPPRNNPDGFAVRVRDVPARTVAYIRVRNPYKSDGVLKAAARLVAWAERRGLADRPWLGYQWENPEITALENCKYHVAIELQSGREPAHGLDLPSGEIGLYQFPAMVAAHVEICGPIELELRALYWLFGTWLPRSGYVPDDQPCFEAWRGRPFSHGTKHFELDVLLPVKRG